MGMDDVKCALLEMENPSYLILSVLASPLKFLDCIHSNI